MRFAARSARRGVRVDRWYAAPEIMLLDRTTLEVVIVLFAATLVRSTLGFGEALVAVPLLSLLLPVEVAAPVAAAVSVTVALVVVVQDFRDVHLRSAGWLVASTLFGIPLGLWMLRTVPEGAVKAILGAVILAFAAYSLKGPGKHTLADDRHAWLFGFGAGVLGGAYGMNGPPLVVYGALRRWSPTRFRATLQGYFLFASLMGLCGYGVAGLCTRDVGRYFLSALPLVALAIGLGRVLHRRLDTERFRRWVHVALAGIGVLLLGEAIVRARG